MIAIGCDHGGYELKKEIEAYLTVEDWSTAITDATAQIL